MTQLPLVEVEATDEFVAANADLWPIAGRISQAIYTLTRPAMNPASEAVNLSEPGVLFTLLTAYATDPEPLSAVAFYRRFPYGRPENREPVFQALVTKDMLTTGGEREYRLTADGRKVAIHLLGVFYDRLREMMPHVTAGVGEPELRQLAQLFDLIVEAALKSPVANWGTRTSHRIVPPTDAVALAYIDQCLDDFNAFRDDAHLAAWQPHNVSGHAWEFFTFLWRGEVATAAQMAEKATTRGYTAQDYEVAAAELQQRSWLQPGTNGYEVTGAGRQIRQQAEQLTERYFFAPWLSLTNDELTEVRDLTSRLAAHLEALVKDAGT
jgi:hypothetical protein